MISSNFYFVLETSPYVMYLFHIGLVIDITFVHIGIVIEVPILFLV